jgi:hypothetical protein
MRDRLKTEANANNRSLNAEIIARLERSLSSSESEVVTMSKREMFDMMLEVVRMTEGGGISTDKNLRKKIVEAQAASEESEEK